MAKATPVRVAGKQADQRRHRAFDPGEFDFERFSTTRRIRNRHLRASLVALLRDGLTIGLCTAAVYGVRGAYDGIPLPQLARGLGGAVAGGVVGGFASLAMVTCVLAGGGRVPIGTAFHHDTPMNLFESRFATTLVLVAGAGGGSLLVSGSPLGVLGTFFGGAIVTARRFVTRQPSPRRECSTDRRRESADLDREDGRSESPH